MSEDDTEHPVDGGARRRERGDKPPMLILGEDRPDLEDTTPEQLRRQQEETEREIERRRREAQEEIERRRQQLAREIAELEDQKQRELQERERELDRTHRRLYRHENRLLRRAGAGSSTGRLVPAPREVPLSQRGLRGSRVAWVTASLAGLGLLVATLTAPGAPSDRRLAELEALDASRVLWLTSAASAAEALTLHVAGQEPSAEVVTEHRQLSEQALAAMPSPGDLRYRNAALTLEDVQERSEEIFDPASSTVRSLTLWDQVHLDLGYAVTQGDVRIVRDKLLPGSATAVTGSVLAALALAILALLARQARSRTSVLLAGSATVLAVATLVLLAGSSREDLDGAARVHANAHLRLSDVHTAVHDDLAEAYGTGMSISGGGPRHFAEDPFPVPTFTSADVGGYLAARSELGRVVHGPDQEAVAPAAVELASAGRALLEGQAEVLGRARADLVDGLRGVGPGTGVTAALTGATALLAAAAVLTSRGQPEPSPERRTRQHRDQQRKTTKESR